MLLNKGDKIEEYTVTFPQKEGSYAETYRVKDAAGKTCFLKLINYGKLGEGQLDYAGQALEVKIVQPLRHPNVCRYVDSGKTVINGVQREYLVTEFISGEVLSKKIARDGKPTIYEIKQVAKSVLSALSYLHNLLIPVLHGEVTIQNIMVEFDKGYGEPKLIDFGHASYSGSAPSMPDLNDLNIHYLAPERFAGENHVQSDLYSVGVLMYHLLFGNPPWAFNVMGYGNTEDREKMILEKRKVGLDFPQPNQFGYDEQLRNCIAKALSYKVEDRFQSADEFIKAIDGETFVPTATNIISEGSRKSPGRWKKTISESAKSVKEGEGFSAIAGMENLKEQMRKEVIEPLHNIEKYERYKVTIPNGMLLYGPPGCGKTFFAKHFAEEVGFNFKCCTPADLKGRYVNWTEKNIAEMFEDAEKNAPTIIFIDEINEIVPKRERGDLNEMYISAVHEMLAQMDRTGERGIFIIGATNKPLDIDSAILRSGRLDKKYYIGPPDRESRRALFELYLKERPCVSSIDFDCLADLTENYVSSDIQLITNNAARKALETDSEITMDLLRAEIQSTRPSVSKEELAHYEEIRRKMDGEAPPRTRIGF